MPCRVQAEKQVILARGVHRHRYTALAVPYISELAWYRVRHLIRLHGAVHRQDFRPKSSPAARMPIKHFTMGRQSHHG